MGPRESSFQTRTKYKLSRQVAVAVHITSLLIIIFIRPTHRKWIGVPHHMHGPHGGAIWLCHRHREGEKPKIPLPCMNEWMNE